MSKKGNYLGGSSIIHAGAWRTKDASFDAYEANRIRQAKLKGKIPEIKPLGMCLADWNELLEQQRRKTKMKKKAKVAPKFRKK